MYKLLFLLCLPHSARSPTHYQLDTSNQLPILSHYIILQIQFKFKFRCALAAPSFLAGLSSSQDMAKPSSLGGTTRSREV